MTSFSIKLGVCFQYCPNASEFSSRFALHGTMQYNVNERTCTVTGFRRLWPKLRSHFIEHQFPMLVATLLTKKREGHALSDDEIEFLIDGFCKCEVADYQMSALAMAICLRGMNEREITTLTRAMLDSGDSMPRLPERDRPRVDKHSTGGLGDNVSLVLAPLLASCGVDVPMISGRGLGLTGGTLDKLESIPGFRTQLTADQSSDVLRKAGAFIVGASDRIAPADRRLYALRDVTGTVESVALITASILSKKLAANLDALAMDVKVGSGAFMKTLDRATELARSLGRVGGEAGLPTTAILSDMDQPLGSAIGNAIEVNEAVQVLCGDGPDDVRELTVELCADLLVQVKMAETRKDAIERLQQAIDQGFAMEHFEKLVHAQEGDLKTPLALAPCREIVAPASGFIASYDCVAIGEAIVGMGGGRRRTDDVIDPTVGVSVHARIGDAVEKGQPIFRVHCHAEQFSDYFVKLENAVVITHHGVDARPLILARI